MKLLVFVLAAVAAVVTVVATPASAQTWPSRSITLVNAFPPGGATDIVARQLALLLTPRLGQSVVVDNRTGAAGTIGAASVARASPDGYTLLFAAAASMVVAPAVLGNAPYDAVGAFSPVVEIARGPFVLSVRSSLPVKSLADLVALARLEPGRLAFGSPGVGSVPHVAGTLLARSAGIDILHVPYKGSGPAYAALLSGEIQILFDSMPSPLPHIASGNLRPIGVAGPERLSGFPEVPTFAEQGFPQIEFQFWWGVVAPAGTPPDIVARLNREIGEALRDPQVRETLARQNLVASPGTAEAFGAFILAERDRWKSIASRTGVRE